MPTLSQSVLGNYKSAPASAIGGTVIALILKAKAKPKPTLAYSGAYTPPRYWMGGIIPVTTRNQEQYIFEAEVTQNPVESGAMLSDHVILRPVRVELTFEVNNIPDSSTAKAVLEQMTKMWGDRKFVSLLTEHGQLDNMICKGIHAVNEAPAWGKLTFRAGFQQVAQVMLTSVKFTPIKTTATEKTGGPNTGKSAQKKKKNGKKTPTKKSLPTSNQSAASKIKGALF